MPRFSLPALTLFIFAFIFTLGIPLAQAINLNPFSALKSAVEATIEDRSSEDIALDLELKARIAAKIVDNMGSDILSLNIDVYEQDVMLTGAVENRRLKAMARSFAKSIKGVKKTYNEIIVIKGIDRKKGATENFIDDSIIEGKINALLLDATGVNVTNFRWRAVTGHVFLFGRAFSKAEETKAITVVKGIKDVKSVKSLVKIVPE